jgi:hypothetical protein
MATEQSGGDSRQRVVTLGVIPGVATVAVTAVTFGVVTGVTLVDGSLITGSVVTQVAALASMYLLPQFLVGTWAGTRHGLSAWPAVAAALAPIVVVVIAFLAWGGPVLSVFENLLLLVGAGLGWTIVAGLGVVVGDRVLGPRLRGETA